MQSKRVIFTGTDRIEIDTVDLAAPGPGQVRVRARRSLISTGTECICLQRRFEQGTGYENWVKYPFAPGYSLVGEVIDVGDGVTRITPGQRVLLARPHAQVALHPAEQAFVIPDSVTDDDATFGVINYVVQHGFRKAALAIGESVAVVGQGLLGQLVVQFARLAGARHVIAIDPAPQRAAMSEQSGATHVLAMPVAEALEPLRDILGGEGTDVVFEMTGHAPVFADALRLPRPRGRVGLIGDTGAPSQQHLIQRVVTDDLHIFGAHGTKPPQPGNPFAPWSQRAMVDLFFHYLTTGQMAVNHLITHHYALDDAAAAYELLTTRRAEAMGVIFDYA